MLAVKPLTRCTGGVGEPRTMFPPILYSSRYKIWSYTQIKSEKEAAPKIHWNIASFGQNHNPSHVLISQNKNILNINYKNAKYYFFSLDNQENTKQFLIMYNHTRLTFNFPMVCNWLCPWKWQPNIYLHWSSLKNSQVQIGIWDIPS